MPNKIHTIIEDIENMQTVNAQHTFRVGILANTVANAKPVFLEDVDKILNLGKDTVKVDDVRDHLPMLLEFNRGVHVSILIVADKDSNDLQCYPFSTNNEDNKWLPYDMAFNIEQGDILQLRVVNSFVVHADPTKEAIDHMEALATVIRCTLGAVGSGAVTIYDMEEDHSVINRKRDKAGKLPILKTFGIK